MGITSRRDFFKKLAFLGLITFSTTSMHAKAAKSNFNYQDTPKGSEKCSDCMHFIAKNNKCKLVEGTIKPKGWCNLFQKDPTQT
jgi:hypothetical protein